MVKIFLNGKEIAVLLRVRRMTQKELAEKAGISEVHISRLINHQAPIGIDAQKRIQNTFKFIPFEKMFTIVDKI